VDAGSVRHARHRATQAFAGWSLPAAVADDATLIVDEILANATAATVALPDAQPTGDWVAARIQVNAGRLRIEVWDRGGGTPTVRGRDDACESGRGLLIVNALAVAWGHRCHPDAGGTLVWADVTIPADDGPTLRLDGGPPAVLGLDTVAIPGDVAAADTVARVSGARAGLHLLGWDRSPTDLDTTGPDTAIRASRLGVIR
jgi:anti-sigma regulatory factor (Ser/Thr protein kinase)